jgi:branched-chain amino acid transport system permease protein
MLTAQVIVNGLLLGGLYACLAMGFSLIWGVMNLINLAHGSMMIMGAYVTWFVATRTGIDPFLTLPLAGAVVFVVAYAIQRCLINRIIDGSVFMTLILTFGVNLVLINLHIVLFTADIRSVPVPYSGAGLEIGGGRIPYVRMAVFALAIALTVGLHVFLQQSRIGRAIRAVAQHRRAAAVVGVDIKEIYALTFAIGGFMAGAAGALLAIVFSFSPVLGDGFTLKSFIVVILGGLGSVPGALLGGVVLGLIESTAMVTLAGGWRDAVAFSLLVLILVLRPQGLLGQPRHGY